MENSQLKQVEEYLQQHNYLLVPKEHCFDILHKAGKPIALILFLVLSAILLFFFAFVNLWLAVVGALLILLAVLLLTNLFNEYVTVNTEQKSIIFKSIIKGRKSIAFSQINEIEWRSRTNTTDTNPFSDSNLEYISNINLLLQGGQQKRLFSFFDEKDNSGHVEKVIKVFQDIFELKAAPASSSTAK